MPKAPETAAKSPLRPALAPPSIERVPSRARRNTLLALAAVLILAAGGFFGYGEWKKTKDNSRGAAPGSDAPSNSVGRAASSESPGAPPSAGPEAPGGSAAAKSPADFKTGSISLSPAKGSSLVYATGSLTNDSPHQRFGVRIQIALADAGGRNVGVAQDYRSVIDPGGVWTFRALILDSKATSASLKQITEEP